MFICLLLKLLLIARCGELQKSMVMLVWSACRAFLPVPGVMQTVQRAEFWGAIVAIQACWPCHLGVDNLNVAGTVGRLLARDCLVKPLPLIGLGDLVALVQYMVPYSWSGDGFGSLRLQVVPRMRMCILVGFGWRINWGTLRLILPLTWVVVISPKFSLIPGAGCSKCVVICTYKCFNCTGL